MNVSLYIFIPTNLLCFPNEKLKKDENGSIIPKYNQKYHYLICKSYDFQNSSSLIKKKFSPYMEKNHYWLNNFLTFNSELALEDFIKFLNTNIGRITMFHKELNKVPECNLTIYKDSIFQGDIEINFDSIIKQNIKNDFNLSKIRDLFISSAMAWAKTSDKNFDYNVNELIGLSDEDDVFEQSDDRDSNRNHRRKIHECQYFYIVGPLRPTRIDNFKIGYATDANDRLYDYKTHSPYRVKMFFAQSCLGNTAKRVESVLKSTLREQRLYQEWYRMNLFDLKDIVHKTLRDLGQPEYTVTKFVPDESNYRDSKDFFITYKDENYYFEYEYQSYKPLDSKVTLFHVKGVYGKLEDNKIKKICKNKDMLTTLEFFYEKICKVKNAKGHKFSFKIGQPHF